MRAPTRFLSAKDFKRSNITKILKKDDVKNMYNWRWTYCF